MLAAAASTETAVIAALCSALERSPLQVNRPFESDAELLDLGTGELLAATVDTLHAGSELVLADGPYERGWLAATASLSDLAAVGAAPVALLLSCTFPRGAVTEDSARSLGAGARDAAVAHGAHVVGGDTNWGEAESHTTVGLGTVARDRVLTRVGARAGDRLYVTGPVGTGNAAGVRALLGEPSAGWRPEARCAAGRALAGLAHACIDTSDGLASAALLLADLNGLGFELDDVPGVYDPAAVALAERLGLPRWLLAVGEWPEYELLFAVAAGEDERVALERLAEVGAAPRCVGRLVAGREYAIVDRAAGTRIDARAIAGRLRDVEVGPALVDELMELIGEGTA